MPSHSASSILAPVRIRGNDRVVASKDWRHVSRKHLSWRRVLASPLGALLATVAREVRIRRDRRDLMELGDHELADIGVRRDQICDAIRTGRLSDYRVDHVR